MNSFNDKNYSYSFQEPREFDFLYKEIFGQAIYKTDCANPKLIVDIGAHIGLASMYFRLIYPNTPIVAFEPNPYNRKLFLENIQMNKIKNIQLRTEAVTNKTGTRDFYIDTKDYWFSTSSLLEKGWDESLELERIEVQTISFESILDMNPTIIKLDVEGVEQSLIKNNVENLHKADYIIIEFHQNKQQDLNKILKYLAKAGFTTNTSVDPLNKNLILIHAQKRN
jgi:FkbM family methyltransferase